MKPVDAQVIVIGAGLSGLATAQQLNAVGFETIVLEARSRIGGRVHSHTLPDGTVIDLGGQMIGPKQTRINKLAKAAGATLLPLSTQGKSIKEPNTSLSLLDRFHVAKLGLRLHKEAKKTPIDTPWTRADAAALDTMSSAQWMSSKGTAPAALVWTDLANQSFCIESNKISALEALHHFASMGGLPGLITAETNYIEQGAGIMVDYLAQNINVMSGMAVHSIKTSNECVSVNTKQKTLYANQVVLAVPPQIGQRLLQARDAQEIGYINQSITGSVVKTVLVYTTPWWKTKKYSGMSTSNIGPASSTYDATPKAAPFGRLMVTSTNEHARALPIDEPTRIQRITDHIDQLFKNDTEKPVYAKSVHWNHEPESLGGFSSVRVPGSWMQQAKRSANSKGPIHFTGTEFAHEWRSYMEGALESAERTTKQVLQSLKT